MERMLYITLPHGVAVCCFKSAKLAPATAHKLLSRHAVASELFAKRTFFQNSRLYEPGELQNRDDLSDAAAGMLLLEGFRLLKHIVRSLSCLQLICPYRGKQSLPATFPVIVDISFQRS